MKDEDIKPTDLIGPFEQLVLTAVVALGDRAYGLAIHERVGELGNRAVRLGAIYTTLERMEEKQYIVSRISPATPQREGRSRRVYKLLESGERVLQESVDMSKRAAETVEDSGWRIGKWKIRRAR
jgi:DNA-binding PadR family transcriptional regulator